MINSVPNKPNQSGSLTTAQSQSQSQQGATGSQKTISAVGVGGSSQKNLSQREGALGHGAPYVPMGSLQTPDKLGVMGDRMEEYNASAAWQSPTVSTPTSSAMHMQGTTPPPLPLPSLSLPLPSPSPRPISLRHLFYFIFIHDTSISIRYYTNIIIPLKEICAPSHSFTEESNHTYPL